MAAFPPSPQRRLRRHSWLLGVENLYSSRPIRIRPATTRGSSPRWSSSGLRARRKGARRPSPDVPRIP